MRLRVCKAKNVKGKKEAGEKECEKVQIKMLRAQARTR